MIRIVQVGFGAIGQRRVRALREVPGVEVAGVVETDAAAREKAREAGLRVESDYRRLLGEGGAGAVIVSLPHHLHAEVTRFALESGAHVLGEKPLGVSGDEAAACARQARASERLLKVGANHLRFPSVELALAKVREGALGALRSVAVTVGHGRYASLPAWFRDRERAGGGTLRDNGSHGVRLLQALLGPGDDFAEVSCELEHAADAPGVDIRARCELTSARGVALRLESRWVGPTPYQFDVEIIGERGWVRLSGPEQVVTRLGGVEARHVLGGHPDDSWRRDTRDFIDAIEAGLREHPSAAEAVRCARVLDALYASAAERRPVQLTSRAAS